MYGPAAAVLVTLRSARRTTVTMAVSELLQEVGSVVWVVAFAPVLHRHPTSTLFPYTTLFRSQVTEAPFTRPGLVQVTVPAAWTQSRAVADTKLVLPGRAEEKTNEVLSRGPRVSSLMV